MATISGLALYQYMSCPYCALVRSTMDRLGLEVEMRDTLQQPEYAEEVWSNTGRGTVPVLRIESEEGEVRWLPESRDIIRYLEERFG